MIFDKLEEKGFEILQKRSVSNIRSSFIKNLLPCSFLLSLESRLQIPFAYINFGPSIFVLARKISTKIRVAIATPIIVSCVCVIIAPSTSKP